MNDGLANRYTGAGSCPYFPVIIVGAGPSGLAMGNLLGLYGLDALLIERNASLSLNPKAIILDDEGLRVCQALGLAEAMQADVLSGLEAHYLSGRRLLVRVAPTTGRNSYPLISTFHQPIFETTLHDGLQRFPTINVKFGCSLETFVQREDGVLVTLRDSTGTLRQVECAYLLACDGAKSTVRSQLKLAMPGTTYAQKWLVVDTFEDSDHSTVVRFFCEPTRPAVTVPVPGKRRRWEFMLLPGEQETEMTQPAMVQALVQGVGGPARPKIARAAIYHFHASVASSFQHGRVFLLGDAAHLMPPFGGQGMNCGLRDVHNLGWKLWLVLCGLAKPSLLASYTLERQAHTRQMLAFSRFLGSIVMTTARPVANLRDTLLTLSNFLPGIRDYLGQGGIKPASRYTRGFHLRAGSRTARALAGQLLPQLTVLNSAGRSVLIDDLLGPGFAFLHLKSAHPQPFVSLEQQPLWQRLDTRLLTLDRTDTLFPLENDLCALVRPDRYIYSIFSAQHASDFTRAFEQRLMRK